MFFVVTTKSEDLSFRCSFEEVYKNQEIQQGEILIKNNKIRYEYFDKNLFTIIYDNNELYVIKNSNTDHYEKIDKNKKLFEIISNIYSEYPNIKKQYLIEDYEVIIEKSTNEYFIKRMAIKSNTINISIYFNNCIKKPINNLFFEYYPLFELPKK